MSLRSTVGEVSLQALRQTAAVQGRRRCVLIFTRRDALSTAGRRPFMRARTTSMSALIISIVKSSA
jgi:hypothetical protein